jgi:hypothetical protein
MIPLLSISQVDLVRKNDTVVCYTKEENRKIALIMVREEKYRALYNANEVLITNLNSKINAINYKISYMDTLLLSKESLIHYQDSTINKAYLDLGKERKNSKRLKTIITGSVILNGVLIILLFI